MQDSLILSVCYRSGITALSYSDVQCFVPANVRATKRSRLDWTWERKACSNIRLMPVSRSVVGRQFSSAVARLISSTLIGTSTVRASRKRTSTESPIMFSHNEI